MGLSPLFAIKALDPRGGGKKKERKRTAIKIVRSDDRVIRMTGGGSSKRPKKGQSGNPIKSAGFPHRSGQSKGLKQVPQKLVVNVVVILHFRRFYERAQQARAAVGRGLLQVEVAVLHVFAEELGGPIGVLEVVHGRIDVVGKVAFGLAQVLDVRRIAL